MFLLTLIVLWEQLKNYILGGGTATVLITLFNYWKDRKKEEISNEKTEAEKDKIKAETYKVKAEADATMVESALKLASKLHEDNITMKDQLKKTQEELEDALIALRDVTTALGELQVRFNDVQHKLNNELQKRVLMERELQDLRAELEKRKS